MSKLTQVEVVAARLLDLDSLYCKDINNWCKSPNPRGHYCTREKYHKGFHVEHSMVTNLAYPTGKVYWWNDNDCS